MKNKYNKENLKHDFISMFIVGAIIIGGLISLAILN